MMTQYLIRPNATAAEVYLPETQLHRFIIEPQRPRALDIVPGFLDLPSGTLDDQCIRRFLNASALFNEHLIVPDGWLHCSGPLSEYLRAQFRKAQAWPGQHTGPKFAADPLLQYLRAGIVVPGLRGDRPSAAGGEPLGFDLLKVWSGEVKDLTGVQRGYGVAGLSDVERMTILDYDNAENYAVISAISKSTRLFVDWTSPNVPITTIGYSSDADRACWDTEFARAIKSTVLDSELAEHGVKAITELLELHPANVEVLPIARDFWFELLDTISRDVGQQRAFRRGTIERAVGNLFGKDRFRSYDPLLAGALGDTAIAHPLRMYHPTAPTLQLRTLLARTLLDRVSTVQQAMFANKFGAHLGFPRRPMPDILDRKILATSGHECDVEEFSSFSEILLNEDIPFENLTPDQVLQLRETHNEFFIACREATPASDFWGSNPDLLKLARAYVTDIAAAVPLSDRQSAAVRNTRKGLVGAGIAGVIAVANPWVAGVSFGMGFGVWWLARKALPPIGNWLTRPLDDQIENKLMKWRARGYADIMVEALDIRSDAPGSAHSSRAA